MRYYLHLLPALLIGASCGRTAVKAPKPSESSTSARLDSSLATLCASPPDTTSGGAHGCVLRDQGRTIGPRPRP